MVNTGRIFWLTAACLLVMAGCHPKRQYYPRTMPERTVEIIRFDSALLSIRADHAADDVQALYDTYPAFMPTFAEQALGVNAMDTDYLAEAFPLFISDTLYGFSKTNQLVLETFADMRGIRQELSQAFTRLAYLYPEISVPQIYTFVSGFNASVLFLEDGNMGIGLDMYLGSDYPYYNQVVYNYQKQTMRKECIPGDVVSGYLFMHFPYASTKSRLIDNMLYRGKLMYVCSTLLDEPDFEVMGYTREQWQWCERYERQVWNRMMDKRDLFKTEQMLLTSYLNDGPFTSEISQEAPPRIGTWIGWRIAESYMEHHPEVSLQQLIANNDAEQILRDSYYKP
ncbi:MAG: hypothetical protein IJT12_00050 [Paludibacteraceae bacterium]|nr:hypothetical protein [Paludibacteraceae bacterium]